jgi:hypothetical protein
MADVVNLNKFRKKKAKAEKEARAATNRRLHGRTKAERMREEAQKKRLENTVRGALLVREKDGRTGVIDDPVEGSHDQKGELGAAEDD